MEVDAMTKQEIQEASKRINEIQLSLWEVEKLLDKGSIEREAVFVARVEMGKIDGILQAKLRG